MDRKWYRSKYKELYDQVEEILFRHDPEGLNYGFNTDEYAPETCTIISRLKEAISELDVRRIVLEEFIRWFSEEIVNPQNPAYDAISIEIWEAWTQYSQKNK